MHLACEPARQHVLRQTPKAPALSTLYSLSSQATHEAVHLLCRMLTFDPVSFFYENSIICEKFFVLENSNSVQ